MPNDTNSLKKSLYRKIKYNLLQRNFSGVTASLRKLPDFLVIGGKRCGTTTLFEFLKQHPSISNPPFDHMGFFDDNYRLGIDYYKSFFPVKNKKNDLMINYDVTTSYLANPHVPERMFKHMPNVKLITLLRNPIARAWSEYNSNLRANKNYDTFETYIENELNDLKNYDFSDKVKNNDYDLTNPNENYLKKGLYAYYLKKWFNVFPKKNFLILSTETFAKNEDYVFTKIFEFLNLPKYEIKNLKQMSKTTYHNTLNPKTKMKLDKFFESPNKELFKLIEQEFTWS